MNESRQGIPIKVSITISRPLDDIWSFMCTPANDALWRTGVRSVEMLSDPPLGIGSRGIHHMWIGGALHWQVIEWKEKQVMGWQFSKGYLRNSTGAYHLKSLGEQTHVTIEASVVGGSRINAIMKVGKPLILTVVNRDMAKLKSILEHR